MCRPQNQDFVCVCVCGKYSNTVLYISLFLGMTPADPQFTKSFLLMEKSDVSTHTGQLPGDIVYTIHVGIKKPQEIGKRQSVFH